MNLHLLSVDDQPLYLPQSSLECFRLSDTSISQSYYQTTFYPNLPLNAVDYQTTHLPQSSLECCRLSNHSFNSILPWMLWIIKPLIYANHAIIQHTNLLGVQTEWPQSMCGKQNSKWQAMYNIMAHCWLKNITCRPKVGGGHKQRCELEIRKRKPVRHYMRQSIWIWPLIILKGKFKISIYEYIKELLTVLPSNMNGISKTLATTHLFNVNPE